MASRGDADDDAVAETFLATLKKELSHGRSWPSKDELRTKVFELIEAFGNCHRRHSTRGYFTRPVREDRPHGCVPGWP